MYFNIFSSFFFFCYLCIEVFEFKWEKDKLIKLIKRKNFIDFNFIF